eukprot:scaffold2875_cov247-Pinguiococcus_pyrenoidosus.AAC.1
MAAVAEVAATATAAATAAAAAAAVHANGDAPRTRVVAAAAAAAVVVAVGTSRRRDSPGTQTAVQTALRRRWVGTAESLARARRLHLAPHTGATSLRIRTLPAPEHPDGRSGSHRDSSGDPPHQSHRRRRHRRYPHNLTVGTARVAPNPALACAAFVRERGIAQEGNSLLAPSFQPFLPGGRSSPSALDGLFGSVLQILQGVTSEAHDLPILGKHVTSPRKIPGERIHVSERRIAARAHLGYFEFAPFLRLSQVLLSRPSSVRIQADARGALCRSNRIVIRSIAGGCQTQAQRERHARRPHGAEDAVKRRSRFCLCIHNTNPPAGASVQP